MGVVVDEGRTTVGAAHVEASGDPTELRECPRRGLGIDAEFDRHRERTGGVGHVVLAPQRQVDRRERATVTFDPEPERPVIGDEVEGESR